MEMEALSWVMAVCSIHEDQAGSPDAGGAAQPEEHDPLVLPDDLDRHGADGDHTEAHHTGHDVDDHGRSASGLIGASAKLTGA